jgi:L-amino acid N-acyltransferase YncA
MALAHTASTPHRELTTREATPDDADVVGRIFFDAFESIATRHGFPTEPPSPDFTAWRAQWMLHHPGFHGIVAERGGELIGSCFVDERAAIAGIGPVTVVPAEQDAGAGRLLMEGALARSRARSVPGVRLVQTAYHYRSLSLYAKLGFVVREPLSVLQGPITATPRHPVRQADPGDLPATSALCLRVHGHERGAEVRDAIDDGTAVVVERDGRITGYATGIGYGWHAVGEIDEDLEALLASADAFMGLGVLVPSRNAELLRWLLEHGARVVQQSTLMSTGLYSEPAGAWLPSILF